MRIVLKSCLGAGVCATAAALLCVFMNDGWEFRLAAPMICLQAVIVASLVWGRLPALAGTIAASLTFAIWLFPPIGSFAIQSPLDRLILTLFQLSSVCVILMAPRNPSRASRMPIPFRRAAPPLTIDSPAESEAAE